MQGLGERIRNLRKERKLTLIEVAKRTGIDQATLSRIENGVMIGTLNSHMKIAEVFSIPLPELYEKVLEKINAVKEERVKHKLETFSHAGGTVAELLTSNVLQKRMMPIVLKFKPKGCTEIEEFPPLSERFIYVIKGSVEITVDRETKSLNAGESFYFNASLPHSFVNPSKSEAAVCLSVMTPVSL